jgi:hypothetical protein
MLFSSNWPDGYPVSHAYFLSTELKFVTTVTESLTC